VPPTIDEQWREARRTTGGQISFTSPMNVLAATRDLTTTPVANLSVGTFMSGTLITNIVLGKVDNQLIEKATAQVTLSDGSRFLGEARIDQAMRRILVYMNVYVDPKGVYYRVNGELFDGSKTAGIVSWAKDNMGKLLVGEVLAGALQGGAQGYMNSQRRDVSVLSGNDQQVVISEQTSGNPSRGALFGGIGAAGEGVSRRLRQQPFIEQFGASGGSRVFILIKPMAIGGNLVQMPSTVSAVGSTPVNQQLPQGGSQTSATPVAMGPPANPSQPIIIQ